MSKARESKITDEEDSSSLALRKPQLLCFVNELTYILMYTK